MEMPNQSNNACGVSPTGNALGGSVNAVYTYPQNTHGHCCHQHCCHCSHQCNNYRPFYTNGGGLAGGLNGSMNTATTPGVINGTTTQNANTDTTQ